MERLLPADITAERAVLGSVLLEREAIVAIADQLFPTAFYLEKHAWIYQAMLNCYARRVPLSRVDFFLMPLWNAIQHCLDVCQAFSATVPAPTASLASPAPDTTRL